VGFEPELFDLEADPEEVCDLAGRADMALVKADFETSLQSICNPVAIDLEAKSDQAALIERHGGMEKILMRGGSSYTPIPGEEVKLLNNDI
jgi:choline-sulfatase